MLKNQSEILTIKGINKYSMTEKHKDDKAALKEIDIVFDEPLAEVNK